MEEKDLQELRDFVRYNELQNVVEKLLFVVGFKSNLSGTRFLIDGIVLRYKNGMSSLCKELYPQIAEKYNTKSKRVERGIRHCINECYQSGELTLLNRIFRCNLVNENYAPTNSELISSVCTAIRIEKQAERKVG